VPDPDLTTVTLTDAHLLGGPEFLAEVRDDATVVADELAPIGSQGEPVHRESAWTGAAWTLVDAARVALIGQAVPTARGGAWTGTGSVGHAGAADLARLNLVARKHVLGPNHPETRNSRALLAECEGALSTPRRRLW
jgi:hypothetical protein